MRERRGGEGREGGGRRYEEGLVRAKDMVPTAWDGGLEGWKTFKEEVEAYVKIKDTNIKDKMDEAREGTDELEMSMTGVEKKTAAELMMLLKGKAGGEARRIIDSAKAENGMEAWRKLHRHYDKMKATKGVEADIQFAALGGRRADNIEDLKKLLIEYDLSLIHI